MEQPENHQERSERGRNIALGAAVGMLIGGAVDTFFGDTGWGFAIGILLGALAGYWAKFPLPRMEYQGHLMRRVLFSGFVFILVLMSAIWMLNNNIGEGYQLLIALIPSIPGMFFAISIGIAISQLDELQRRIQLEGIGIAFGGSILVAISYALLVLAGFPEVSWMFVPLMMVIMWFIGKLWTMWKYR